MVSNVRAICSAKSLEEFEDFLATSSPSLPLISTEFIKTQNIKVLDIFLVFPANLKSAQSEFRYKHCAHITEPNQNYLKSPQLAPIYN